MFVKKEKKKKRAVSFADPFGLVSVSPLHTAVHEKWVHICGHGHELGLQNQGGFLTFAR